MRKDKRAFCCVFLFVFPYPSGSVEVVSKVGAAMPLKGVSAPDSDAGLPWKRGVERVRKWFKYALAK